MCFKHQKYPSFSLSEVHYLLQSASGYPVRYTFFSINIIVDTLLNKDIYFSNFHISGMFKYNLYGLKVCKCIIVILSKKLFADVCLVVLIGTPLHFLLIFVVIRTFRRELDPFGKSCSINE